MARQSEAGATKPLPVAFQAEIECSGFFSASSIAHNVALAGGAGNDFLDPLHQLVPGNYVYLQTHKGAGPQVETEFRVVRPAGESFLKAWSSTGVGRLYEFGSMKRFPG